LHITMIKNSVFRFQLFGFWFLTPETRHLKPLILQSAISNLKSTSRLPHIIATKCQHLLLEFLAGYNLEKILHQ
jgi:hypothetical protein